MKDPKFRGIAHVSGNFVEGHYFINSGLPTIHTGHTLYVINKDTLGQFTGLADKNGVEIYTGDILKDGKGGNGVVVFAAPQFVVHAEGKLFNLAEGKVNVGVLKYTKVIGNIHRNPELCKQ